MTENSAPPRSSGDGGLTILGATGSIGKNTLDVIARHSDRYHPFALTAHRSAQALIELCVRYQPRYAVLSGLSESTDLIRRFAEAGCRGELLFGPAALVQVATDPGCSTVMAAIVGAAGLAPTLAAAARGKRVLLANKEALVMAGPLFMDAVGRGKGTLLPIDSEHNAVFQCLPHDGHGRTSLGSVRRVVLTASGGPLRTLPLERFADVTPSQACAHPNWVMGRKISVDSATMMNKGLEVIEAHWLFAIPAERIEVLVHPQSIVHSLVEYVDGSVIAQLSNPDMRVPIAHALGFPDRIESGVAPLNLGAVGQLSFEQPDARRYPCLALAYQALRAGGTAPAVLNAANEVAVESFLAGGLRFVDIARVTESVMQRTATGPATVLEDVMAADALARRAASAEIEKALGRAA